MGKETVFMPRCSSAQRSDYAWLVSFGGKYS